jgi:hypothetical protein
MTRRLAIEAPYWVVVRELGHAEADRQLAEDPDGGVITATGARPSPDALGAALWLDGGSGHFEDSPVDFAPAATLAVDVPADPEARVLPVTGWEEMGEIGIGSLAWMGGEFLRVDGITAASVTVGRGCLDTVPKPHAAGTPILFLDAAARLSETRFAAGETVGVRLLTETGAGTLALAASPEDSVTLARRALRPLPPGNFRADGAFSGGFWTGAEVVFAWAHRDRLTQTSPVLDDHTAGHIGPEPGTSYRLAGFALAADGDVLAQVFEETELVVTERTLGTADLDMALPPETAALLWEVAALRDGLASREAARLVLAMPLPGLMRIGSADELDPPARVLIGDGGRIRH